MSFWCHRFDQNSNENIVRISALKFFIASWGLPGSFLGLPGDLVSTVFWAKHHYSILNISKKFAIVIHVPICRAFIFSIDLKGKKSPCNCKEICNHSPIRTKFMAIDNKSGKHTEKYETCWAKLGEFPICTYISINAQVA